MRQSALDEQFNAAPHRIKISSLQLLVHQLLMRQPNMKIEITQSAHEGWVIVSSQDAGERALIRQRILEL